jgi:hypothetical protein
MTGRATSLADLLVGLVPIALIVGLWQLLASTGVAPASLLPAPGAVFARLVEQLGSPTYLGHAATTLFRLFAGFGIAVVIGVALGVAAMGLRAVEVGLMPLVRVLAPIPKIALYPAFILTLGFENASRSRSSSPTRLSRSCSRPIRAHRRSSRSSPGLRRRSGSRDFAACSRWCCPRRCRRSSPAAGSRWSFPALSCFSPR